jgi:DNA polymerase I-like protein with 3'-5' exonuclease and polymerase domains
VLFVVDEDKAEWAKEIITDTLTRKIEGIPVTFTAEAEIGKSWKET